MTRSASQPSGRSSTGATSETRAMLAKVAAVIAGYAKTLRKYGYNESAPTFEALASECQVALAKADLSGWQPIETAPKDGTAVDLWTSDGRMCDCFWQPGNNHHPEGGWYSYDLNYHDGDWLDGEGIVATHWQSLPAPPCDSNSDPQGGDALAAPGEASQSGGSDSERIAQPSGKSE